MLMHINGLRAQINCPKAVENTINVHGLPPHAPVDTYNVDEYPACPEHWEHGSSKVSSYFMAVEEGHGMWFDFTMNQSHSHDVAVVVSVQGVNPITGPIEKGELADLCLEQYVSKCPRHDIEFESNRFCPKCKFNWPKQNYVSSTASSTMWIDGFRTKNGEVRQYVFTAEEAKGVAAQMIGNKRVYAIGFAFFLSKEPKPITPSIVTTQSFSHIYGDLYDHNHGHGFKGLMSTAPINMVDNSTQASTIKATGVESSGFNSKSAMGSVLRSAKKPKSLSTPKKNLEIGAGGIIKQNIGDDPNNLDYWEDTPAGMIYVNYTNPQLLEQILAAGKREEETEGAFQGLNQVN